MEWNQEIFYNNIMLLIKERCAGNSTIFNDKIHSRDAATRWKTKKPTLKALDTIADVFDVSMNWLRTGQGEPAVAADPSDQVTLRDILKLHEEIHRLASEIGELKTALQKTTVDLGKEIGDLKTDLIHKERRLQEAAETGDIHRLGVVGGKGG